MTTDLPEGLLAYFATRHQERAAAVDRTLAMLTPYELRLVKEAAVMGYVRGALAAKHRDAIPPDSAVLAEVVDACLAMSDLYPTIAAAERGVRDDQEVTP